MAKAGIMQDPKQYFKILFNKRLHLNLMLKFIFYTSISCCDYSLFSSEQFDALKSFQKWK